MKTRADERTAEGGAARGGLRATPGGWRWQVVLGRDDRGRLVRRSGSAVTQAEASEAMARTMAGHAGR